MLNIFKREKSPCTNLPNTINKSCGKFRNNMECSTLENKIIKIPFNCTSLWIIYTFLRVILLKIVQCHKKFWSCNIKWGKFWMHYLIFKLILTSVIVTNYIINSTNFRYMKGESESVSHSIMSNSLRPHGL